MMNEFSFFLLIPFDVKTINRYLLTSFDTKKKGFDGVKIPYTIFRF